MISWHKEQKDGAYTIQIETDQKWLMDFIDKQCRKAVEMEERVGNVEKWLGSEVEE